MMKILYFFIGNKEEKEVRKISKLFFAVIIVYSLIAGQELLSNGDTDVFTIFMLIIPILYWGGLMTAARIILFIRKYTDPFEIEESLEDLLINYKRMRYYKYANIGERIAILFGYGILIYCIYKLLFPLRHMFREDFVNDSSNLFNYVTLLGFGIVVIQIIESPLKARIEDAIKLKKDKKTREKININRRKKLLKKRRLQK